MAIKVTLTVPEVRMAQFITAYRGKVNRDHKVKENLQAGNRAAENPDAMGAEIAAAHIFNVYPDFTTQPRHGSPDFTLHDGSRVDVKNTPDGEGWLNVAFSKTLGQVEYFVQVVGKLPTFDVDGYATEKDVLCKENIHPPKFEGKAPYYAFHPSRLKPIEELMN